MSRIQAKIHESGPNIFADLGLPDADGHFLKAQIVSEIYRLAKERKLNIISVLISMAYWALLLFLMQKVHY